MAVGTCPSRRWQRESLQTPPGHTLIYLRPHCRLLRGVSHARLPNPRHEPISDLPLVFGVSVELMRSADKHAAMTPARGCMQAQSADTVRLLAQARSAATFSAMTTARGRVLCISWAIRAAVTGWLDA